MTQARVYRTRRPDHRHYPGSSAEAALHHRRQGTEPAGRYAGRRVTRQAGSKYLDTTWTKKHGKSHDDGGKFSIHADKRYQVISKLETDTAATHDSQHFDAVLDPGDTRRDVYANQGHPNAAREDKLKAAGYHHHIQRKGQRNRPLSDCQERRNRHIAKTRARVEHVFGAMAKMEGKWMRIVGQARANFAMTMMPTCYNFQRLVYLKRAAIEAS